ncbi:MAG: TIGR02266 family protein [bacterium]
MNMNKRRTPRVMVKVVIVSIDDESIKLLLDYPDSEAYLYDYSTNFSEGGIFLKVTEPIPIGKQVSMKFTIPNDVNLLEATGIVRWYISAKEAQLNNISPGIGIEFTGMTEETKQRIKSFINDIK